LGGEEGTDDTQETEEADVEGVVAGVKGGMKGEALVGRFGEEKGKGRPAVDISWQF